MHRMHGESNRVVQQIVCIHWVHRTEVVNEAAEQSFIDATGEKPLPGGRRVDTWSMCFQGGTFDRIKERCGSLLSVAVRYACVYRCTYCMCMI